MATPKLIEEFINSIKNLRLLAKKSKKNIPGNNPWETWKNNPMSSQAQTTNSPDQIVEKCLKFAKTDIQEIKKEHEKKSLSKPDQNVLENVEKTANALANDKETNLSKGVRERLKEFARSIGNWIRSKTEKKILLFGDHALHKSLLDGKNPDVLSGGEKPLTRKKKLKNKIKRNIPTASSKPKLGPGHGTDT